MTNSINHSLDVDTTVVICVGEGHVNSKREHNVPMCFAIKSSRFLQSALSGEGMKSGEKRVSLPATDWREFKVYLEWFYTGHIVTHDTLPFRGRTVLRLYLMGDSLGDDHFSNAVVDILIRDCGSCAMILYSADVDLIWTNTLPGNNLRKLLVELIIRNVGEDHGSPWFFERGTWSHDVTAEVFARLSESKKVAIEMSARTKDSKNINQAILSAVAHPKDNKDKCASYHKHSEGNPRCTVDQQQTITWRICG